MRKEFPGNERNILVKYMKINKNVQIRQTYITSENKTGKCRDLQTRGKIVRLNKEHRCGCEVDMAARVSECYITHLGSMFLSITAWVRKGSKTRCIRYQKVTQ